MIRPRHLEAVPTVDDDLPVVGHSENLELGIDEDAGDGELVDEHELLDGAGPTVLVDGEVEAGPAPLVVETDRELVPGWAKDRVSFTSAVRAWIDRAVFVTVFHVTRSPVYGARLAARSPVGSARLLIGVARWIADAGSLPARDALVHSVSTDSRGADALYRENERHRQAVRTRAVLALAGLVTLTVVGVWALIALAWWELGSLAGAIIAALGHLGRAPDKAIADRATAKQRAPKLTSELIVTALSSLGLGKMNTALRNDEYGHAITFVSPITRDGPGWRADLDLPVGVTAAEIVDRRAALASGLRRPLGCVWPEPDPDAHEGRLVLYVADKPLAGAKAKAWELQDRGSTNVFDPVPIGVDQRGRPVTVVLMFASGLIGAVPRVGKTFLLRLLCLVAALDRRVESHVYNLKGGSDLHPLRHTAHAYRSGDDDDDIAYALADLRELREEMRRRYRRIEALPIEVAPESKVTDEIASAKRHRLWPVLLAVDECQVWFDHPDHGKELIEINTDLVKRGPAVGIMAWYATQRPDANSIPTAISDNAVLRFCLKVNSQAANDMVLGTSMYKAGYRATMFNRSRDLGIAWFAGETTDPVIVRSAYVDNPTAETIAQRARAAKTAGDWLTGAAAGLDPEPDTDTASILDHLAFVWPAGHDKVWCEALAERLAEHLPGTYEGWTGEQVTAAVKPHGLSTVQIKRSGQNRRGIARDDLTAALAERNDEPDPVDTERLDGG